MTDGQSGYNKQSVESLLSGYLKKEKYIFYGKQTVDIQYGNRVAIIASSQYANSAYLAFICSNYNNVGTKTDVIKRGDVYISDISHKKNDIDTITVEAPSNYAWFILYL